MEGRGVSILHRLFMCADLRFGTVVIPLEFFNRWHVRDYFTASCDRFGVFVRVDWTPYWTLAMAPHLPVTKSCGKSSYRERMKSSRPPPDSYRKKLQTLTQRQQGKYAFSSYKRNKASEQHLSAHSLFTRRTYMHWQMWAFKTNVVNQQVMGMRVK
eukprot:6182342-Pleurochrysis_carterae.AAC.6